MCAIGWRKSYDEYQLFGRFGRYRHDAATQLNQSVYDTLMRSSRQPLEILGGMFRNLASVAFEDNQAIMKRHSIPGFASLHYHEPALPDDCAPHTTFTSGGFYNSPHTDDQDVSEYAFALIVPTKKSDRSLSGPKEGYNVEGRPFIFPDYNFGIDFSEQKGIVKIVWAANKYRHFTLPAPNTATHSRIAMSLQINKKTTDNCDNIQTSKVLTRPKNIGNEDKLYISNHTHLLKSTSQKNME
ncbi:hypothetical protein MJO29_006557 [Puccinia striiformis f. sp. tritici]|uniref:Tet-like 2OG-Fe(II) oxygenase domain-containing protein n=3 Tax=Puccinia striiformis TaxID=27350 RepID=A0A0L0VVC0_9BASI|nr:hypothetical protein MJO29_006557 [Puccinia striiformis f. sp. tritici]KAI9629319.1 hypothetical protein KEM48_013064 [Puccinia striiformis f. sp. tritici PST-130]KNF03142.1 hypothetical protein PSTG_03727 [Puccinia striiformis f. sp. tritici PST-78]POW23248.1 hypothetical protein PSHT_00364 [Puccinia striiformis]